MLDTSSQAGRRSCVYLRSCRTVLVRRANHDAVSQIISKKWGFTDVKREDFAELKANKQVLNDGAYVQVSLLFPSIISLTSSLTTSCAPTVHQAQGSPSQEPPKPGACLSASFGASRSRSDGQALERVVMAGGLGCCWDCICMGCIGLA